MKFWAHGVVVAALLMLAAGCSDSSTAEYRSYDELAGGQPADVAEQQASPNGGSTDSADVAAAQSGIGPADEFGDPDGGDTQPAVAPLPEATAAADAVAVRPVDVGNPLPNDPAGTQPTEPAGRKVQVLIKEKSFRTEGPEGALRVTYDDIDLLKVLNMEPVTPEAPALMPDWLKQLDGQRIRLRGFMYPPPLETGIQAFALARDNQICCFGKSAKIYDKFPVFLREGVTTDYIFNRPFDVVGVFHIRPELLDGELYQLYEIDDAIVIDK